MIDYDDYPFEPRSNLQNITLIGGHRSGAVLAIDLGKQSIISTCYIDHQFYRQVRLDIAALPIADSINREDYKIEQIRIGDRTIYIGVLTSMSVFDAFQLLLENLQVTSNFKQSHRPAIDFGLQIGANIAKEWRSTISDETYVALEITQTNNVVGEEIAAKIKKQTYY